MAVSAEACLDFPGFLASAAGVSEEAFDFPDFLTSDPSGASTVTTLSSSLALLASLGGAVSETHSVINQAKIIRRFSHVILAMDNGDLRNKGQEEEGVEGLPVQLLFGACEVAGGGAKKDLRDW